MLVRRIDKQIPWPDRILKIASEWGRKSKKLVMRESIQFQRDKGMCVGMPYIDLRDFKQGLVLIETVRKKYGRIYS